MLNIKTKGSPFERGKQQGEASKKTAFKWIIPGLEELNEDNSKNIYKTSYTERTLSNYKSSFSRVYPEGYEECCGIAAGLNISEDDYFKAAYSWRLLSKFQNCTSIGFYTRENKPLLGKTDDISKGDLGSNIIEITYPDVGYKHIHFHFAGGIWSTAGINECGLSFGMTGIPGIEISEDGYTSLDALHTILPNCANVKDVILHLNSIKLNYYGFSLIVGDRMGNLSLIEKTGNGMVELKLPEDGFYIHTNHILDLELASKNPPQKEPILSNGIKRYNNALSLITDMQKTTEGMVGFLNNRSIEGPIRQQGEDELFTDYSVLFRPEKSMLAYFSAEANYKMKIIDLKEIF